MLLEKFYSRVRDVFIKVPITCYVKHAQKANNVEVSQLTRRTKITFTMCVKESITANEYSFPSTLTAIFLINYSGKQLTAVSMTNCSCQICTEIRFFILQQFFRMIIHN